MDDANTVGTICLGLVIYSSVFSILSALYVHSLLHLTFPYSHSQELLFV